MTAGKFLTWWLLSVCLVSATCSLDRCLKNDSISCLQKQIYRTARRYFDKSNIEFFGLSVRTRREGKSLGEKEAEERITSASSVEQRQVALQDYLLEEVKHLWRDGSVSWSPMKAARNLIESIPEDVKVEISNFVEEGRAKEKKQMQMLLPLLIGIKLKLAALAALGYMGIALIAKKAVLAGMISFIVSGFIAVKNLIDSYKKHDEIAPYHAWEPVYPYWQQGVYHQQDLAGQTAHQGS